MTINSLDLTHITNSLCDKRCSLERLSDSLQNLVPISPSVLTILQGGGEGVRKKYKLISSYVRLVFRLN